MEFPQVDLPVDMIAWIEVTEDILNIYKQYVPPESMHLCTMHRRFHHGIHQLDGYGNQARGFYHPASRNHHTVLRTKGKSVPGIAQAVVIEHC